MRSGNDLPVLNFKNKLISVLPATVTGIADHHAGQSIVLLQVDNQALLAHITRKSALQLGWHGGYAQIKAALILN